MRTKAVWMAMFLSMAFAGAVQAEIVTKPVGYKHGDVELTGYLAYDDAAAGKLPGVLVVHEWWGLNDYAKKRARMLAELGYVAFCVDMYGTGKVTGDPAQAKAWATTMYSNRDLWVARVNKGLETFKKQPQLDTQRIGAIGYCFGGATVLNLAISGADVSAVVSFHGSLPTVPADAKIKASVPVCHGAADGFTKPQEMLAFIDGMNKSGADWQMHSYGQAVHSFTNPKADAHGIPGVAYNKVADERSWRAMQTLFKDKLVAKPQAGTGQIHIFVNADGSFLINGESVELKDLSKQLETFAKDTTVVLEGDSRTPVKTMMQMVEALRKAGFRKLAIATREQG